jgi:hypothetical protein
MNSPGPLSPIWDTCNRRTRTVIRPVKTLFAIGSSQDQEPVTYNPVSRPIRYIGRLLNDLLTPKSPNDTGVKIAMENLLGVSMNAQLRHAIRRLFEALLYTLSLATLGRFRAQAGLQYQDGATTPPVLTHFVQPE